MSTRSLLLTLSFLLVMLLALLSLGCTGKDTNQTNTNAGGNERIIVPEQTWKPAENGTTEEQTGQPSVIPVEPSTGEESGAENKPSTTITVALLINGIEQPSDRPLFVSENQRVECEFRIKSTGAELASYMIKQGTKAPLNRAGELSGNEATVPFGFTYISRLWLDDGGIGISVSAKDGSGTLRQWIVVRDPNSIIPGTSS